MPKRLIVLTLILVLTLAQTASALDWKNIHERADQISLAQAKKLSTQDPKSLDLLYLYGLVCLNAHQNEQAAKIFEWMLKLNPRSTEARWGRAEVWRRQRKLEQSEKVFKQLIEVDPNFAPAYISLAYLKYTRLDFKASLKLAKRVKRLGRAQVDLSNYVRAYLLIGGNRGLLAYYGGPLAKVINGTAVLPNLKKAEKLQPDSPAVLFGLGSFYFLSPAIIGGNIKKAEDYLRRAIELDPLFADAYVRLAQVYAVKGEKQRYELYLRRALEIDPQNELALDAESGKCAFICLSVQE